MKRRAMGVSGEVNLYPAEIQVLCLIHTSPELTVTDIASKLSITKSAASQSVKKLCSKNMLQKYRCKENERIVILKNTEQGKRVVEDFFSTQTQVFGEFVKEFSSTPDKELDTIRQFLTRLEDMFDKKLQ